MPPLIVAHRGASSEAPENTLRSFRLGWEQHADAIEGDFHLTSDGQIVCMHDHTTARTGNADLVLRDSTLAQLRQVDVGLHKGAQFKGERIPTFAEVLSTVPQGGKIFMELKAGPEIVAPIKAQLEQCRFPVGQVMAISFNSDAIAEVKRQMPDMKTAWLCGFQEKEGRWTPTVDEVLEVLRQCRADGLDCHASACVDAEFVRKLRQAGMGFHVWTVDDPQTARRFAQLGVDSITTNRPAAIRAALGS